MNLFKEIDEDITLLLDNLPIGIVRLNYNKQCIYANKFIYEILDVISCEEINHTMNVCIYEEDREQEKNLCSEFLNNLVESESSFRLYNKIKKEYRWMSNKRTVIKPTNPSNEFSFIYTLQDIHDNKIMEINLINETIKAEEAYNHKSVFLANISHEVRSPINGIVGMLTLLEDTELNSEQQDYISMIKECCFNLMTIVNDILDYSKLEVGKISLNLKKMDLRECIESTNDIILSKIYEKSLKYSYNIRNDIPTFIKNDSNRIKQILLNLLSNAIKFTDKGSIFLNIELISESEYTFLSNLKSDKTNNSNDTSSFISLDSSELSIDANNLSQPNFAFLRFDITDTGCGIDSSDYYKLFKSFSQIDNRLTSKIYQGTGLGLAISKEIIDLMNGCIWLDWSEVAKGSRFSFILKTEICEDDTQSNEQYEHDILILKNKNVLILDDNVYNRISLTGMVSKWGMKAYSFSNTEEALYFSKITHFDIGLIDICIPKMDGKTFASKLKEQTNNKTFPLIALSSLGDKIPSLSKYFKMNLVKPIKENKLKQICIDILKISNSNNSNDLSNNSSNSSNSTTNSTNSTNSNNKDNNEKSLDSYILKNNIPGLKDDIRILLAEDIYINQKVIIGFLNKMSFHNIQTVEDGEACLNLVKELNFDIILLDIRMPIMNGDIALKNIIEFYDQNTSRKKPYIVAVTAYCLKEDKEKYLNMGFDDYIPKPISYNELLTCMNNYIQNLLNN
jgi:signal transduction histidine kinase/DNA-binding response OmpR family regulator